MPLRVSKIAAGAFDPHHFDFCAGERVFLNGLAGSVAAPEVRHAQIRAEDIGSV
jgi:hypothetical protein